LFCGAGRRYLLSIYQFFSIERAAGGLILNFPGISGDLAELIAIIQFLFLFPHPDENKIGGLYP
jgi:hypothetical protein